jgi:O-antigen/teichoic acid export membrane protein
MISNQDKKNAFWNSSVFVISSVAGFVNFSLTLKAYSSEIFGLFILMTSIFGLGYTFDFGFGAATIKQLSVAKKDNDLNLIKRFFFTYLITYVMISLFITFIISVYYVMFIKDSLIVSTLKNVNTNILFIFISGSYIFKYINNYLKNIFEGFSEFIVLSKILFVITFINTLLIVILFVFKLELMYLAFFTFLIQLISDLILIIRLIYSHRELNISFKYFDYSLIKKYLLYGFNIQLSKFIGSLIDPVIKLLIGNYLSLSFVTFYETSKKIIDLSNGLIFSAQKGLFNKLSEHHFSGTLNNYVNNNLFYYSKMSNYYSILAYGLMNPLICFGMLFWFKSFESVIILLLFFIPYSLINYGGAMYLVLMVDGKGLKLVLIQLLNLCTIFLFLFVSLYYSGSYLGLSGFYLSIIINMVVIFSLLRKANDLNIKLYIENTMLFDVVKLNIILLIQVFLMFTYEDYYISILIFFMLVYYVVFYKYAKYFYNVFVEKILKGKFKIL